MLGQKLLYTVPGDFLDIFHRASNATFDYGMGQGYSKPLTISGQVYMNPKKTRSVSGAISGGGNHSLIRNSPPTQLATNWLLKLAQKSGGPRGGQFQA